MCAPCAGPLLGLVGLPLSLLELAEHASVQHPRHVDLHVELAELGLEVRFGDRLERAGVDHRRVALLVGEVELDLEADGASLGVEARLAEHSREHVEAGAHLLAVALAVLAREDGGGYFLPHALSLPRPPARRASAATARHRGAARSGGHVRRQKRPRTQRLGEEPRLIAVMPRGRGFSDCK